MLKCDDTFAELQSKSYDLHDQIFCSPYRRTIETAIHIIKSHPRKHEFTVVLCPEARERVSFQNAFLIRGSRLRTYCEEMQEKHGIRIDASFLDKYASPIELNFWHIAELKDSDLK